MFHVVWSSVVDGWCILMLPGISFLYFSNSFLIIITIIIIIIIIIHTIQDIYFPTMYTYVNILYSVNLYIL